MLLYSPSSPLLSSLLLSSPLLSSPPFLSSPLLSSPPLFSLLLPSPPSSSQEVDDDEVTNSQAGERAQQKGEGAGVGMPTSRWTIDGEELLRSDIDVRYVCVCT